MTNERLEDYCRNADVSNAKWAIPDKVAVFDLPDPKSDSPYEDFIILFDNGVRVGAILPMDNSDLHMLTLPEHRNKGYMSNFFRTGIFKLIRPKIDVVSTNCMLLEENEHYAETMAIIESGTAENLDYEYKQIYEDMEKERKKIEHIMALSGIKTLYGSNGYSHIEGCVEKMRIPITCPRCQKINNRVWNFYIMHSNYIKETGAIHHIIDYRDCECVHCCDYFHLIGGILEYPRKECHFHTLKAKKHDYIDD
jgi:hypothetical protein